MNAILTKACEELAKDQPNIAYVRGMLETALAMSLTANNPTGVASPPKLDIPPMIEGVPPTMPIDKIKAIAEASAE